MSKGYTIDNNNHAFITTDSPAIAEFFKEKHPKIEVAYVGEGEDIYSTSNNEYRDNFMDGYVDGKLSGIIQGFIKGLIISGGIIFLGVKGKKIITKKLEKRKKMKKIKEEIMLMISDHNSNTIVLNKISKLYPEMDIEELAKLIIELRKKLNG